MFKKLISRELINTPLLNTQPFVHGVQLYDELTEAYDNRFFRIQN